MKIQAQKENEVQSQKLQLEQISCRARVPDMNMFPKFHKSSEV